MVTGSAGSGGSGCARSSPLTVSPWVVLSCGSCASPRSAFSSEVFPTRPSPTTTTLDAHCRTGSWPRSRRKVRTALVPPATTSGGGVVRGLPSRPRTVSRRSRPSVVGRVVSRLSSRWSSVSRSSAPMPSGNEERRLSRRDRCSRPSSRVTQSGTSVRRFASRASSFREVSPAREFGRDSRSLPPRYKDFRSVSPLSSAGRRVRRLTMSRSRLKCRRRAIRAGSSTSPVPVRSR